MTRIALSALALVLIAIVLTMAIDPTWDLMAEVNYATKGEGP